VTVASLVRLNSVITSLLRSLIDIAAPRVCLGCKTPIAPREGGTGERAALRAVLCAACRSDLVLVGDGACRGCARPRKAFAPPRGSRCGRCAREPRGGVRRTVALYRYTRRGRDLLRQLKFRGRRDAAAPLGRALAIQVEREIPEIVGACGVALVAPVPMHWTRRLWRGYDHVELMARAAARELGLPLERVLTRTRRTRPLFTVPRRDREAVLEGALAASPSVEGRWVLVIDDIRTSGATLATCGRALREAGAARVDAAVVGRS